MSIEDFPQEIFDKDEFILEEENNTNYCSITQLRLN